MKRRVLFLHQNAVLGGAELCLLDAAKYFHESSLVVLFGDGPLRIKLQEAGVKVRIFPTSWAQEGVVGGKPKLNLRGAMAIGSLSLRIAMLSLKYDVIYANSAKALTIASVAGFLARKPVLWAFHELLDPAAFSPEAMRQLVTFANWGASRIVTCSAGSAASLKREGCRISQTYVVYPGIDPEGFREDAAKLRALRDELGFPDGPVVAVFGRIIPSKGQHVAIELLDRFPDLNLLLVGQAEENYLNTVRLRAAELKCSARLRILGHRDDVPALMELADIVLLTSIIHEPFGRVVVEGMLAGKPVIGAGVGGVPEIIEDGVSGVLVPPADVDALASAVSSLLRDPARANAIAAAGKERARSRFTLSMMLQALDRHVAEVHR